MVAATAMYGTRANPVAWSVLSYRDAGRVATSCAKCSQGIRYIVTVKSANGEVLEVGRDCTTTLVGGVDLAELRAAEARWEREQYLASPEYAERCAREAARAAEIAEAKASAETEHAFELMALRMIVASPNCSNFDKDHAKGRIDRIVEGLWYPLDPEPAERFGLAATVAALPESKHAGEVGAKIERKAIFEAVIPIEGSEWGTNYINKFRSEDGEALVWFSRSCPLYRDDLGEWVTIKGTVKSHGEYQGIAQTTLTRCKVVSRETKGGS